MRRAHWGGVTKAGAVALLVLAASLRPVEFTRELPIGIPSVAGWEKINGEAELKDPHTIVRYEFYVNPARYATYELVRYRITRSLPGEPASDSEGSERLQWDIDGRQIRRFECTRAPAPGAPCGWREVERGTSEYDHESWEILWLYELHRRLLRERDGGPASRP